MTAEEARLRACCAFLNYTKRSIEQSSGNYQTNTRVDIRSDTDKSIVKFVIDTLEKDGYKVQHTGCYLFIWW